MEIQYKDFTIEAAPYQLADSGKWAMQVYIRRHIGGSVKSKPFYTGITFDTKEEATRHCVEFAKNIIDGRYPNCSVDDLL
jgi:hypothetical protein